MSYRNEEIGPATVRQRRATVQSKSKAHTRAAANKGAMTVTKPREASPQRGRTVLPTQPSVGSSGLATKPPSPTERKRARLILALPKIVKDYITGKRSIAAAAVELKLSQPTVYAALKAHYPDLISRARSMSNPITGTPTDKRGQASFAAKPNGPAPDLEPTPRALKWADLDRALPEILHRYITQGHSIDALASEFNVSAALVYKAVDMRYPGLRLGQGGYRPPVPLHIRGQIAADRITKSGTTQTSTPEMVASRARQQASARSEPTLASPAATPNGATLHTKPTPGAPRGKRGRTSSVAETIIPPSDLALPARVTVRSLVNELVEYQKYRRFAIKGQQICDRRTEALIAAELGYEPDPEQQEEKTRRDIFKRAAAIRASIEKTHKEYTKANRNSTPPAPAEIDARRADDLVSVVILNAQSRATWDMVREQKQKQMAEIAKLLPVYTWASQVIGFGERGLAIVTAEAAGFDIDGTERRRRTIGEYRTVSGLWKRMGLAVINGQRQRRVATTEGGLEQQYKPDRRAECWTIGESLLKAQVCSESRAAREALQSSPAAMATCAARGLVIDKLKGAKHLPILRELVTELGLTAQQHALGPYGEVYLRRRNHTNPRVTATEDMPLMIGGRYNPEKWTPKRSHADATRVMFKKLLEDLYRAWRRTDGEVVMADAAE